MERLTVKSGKRYELTSAGDSALNCTALCYCVDHNCGICDIQKALNRLGELEDALENGTLLDAPCKVGDSVWYIAFGRVYEGKVHAITFGGRNNVKGGQIHIYDYDKDNASLKLSEFNKTIFFTKEAAEQKLEEIKKQ